MKKLFNWQIILALVLISLSLGFYALDYFLFGKLDDIIFYGLIDVAFLFLSVLIVTLFLHRLMEYREKKSMLKKLNMVIGTFFSEVGTNLLKECAGYKQKDITNSLLVSGNWQEKDFLAAKRFVTGSAIEISCSSKDLAKLKTFLVNKRPFLLSLLGNPNLLEHESFTDLLWAVFHITDELSHRKSFNKLPGTDAKHLYGDINRAYSKLVLQWLDYLSHLKSDYPYLFSLAIRLNPFNKNSEITVK